MRLKQVAFIFLLLFLLQATSFGTVYNWNTWVAGALTYSTTNMTATVTNTNFDTRGPQDPNGGTSNGYKSPKYVSTATINTYQGGFTNDYGMQGLVLGLDWPNLTSSTTVTITFTTPVAGPVSFSLYDINTGSWGGNDPVWIDKITIAGTNCSGTPVYPVITGCNNNVSGANNNIITGNQGCTNNTNTITFNSPTIKTITVTYASGSPLASGYGTDPDPEYIIISEITTSNTSLVAVANNAGITCTSSTVALNGSSSVSGALYSWTGPNSNNPAGTTPTSASTTVSAVGTYVLAVTDPSSGCVFRDTVTVSANNAPPGASIATPGVLGCSASSVTLQASSPTGGVSYSWSGGGTGSTKTVTAAGTYTVTVTGPGNGCTSTASVTVTSNGAPLVFNVSTTPASCGNSNGSATVNVTSGTATGYIWSNGASGQTASNLGAGSFVVTVTETGGCTGTAQFSVSSTGGITVTASSNNATCGNNNGSATVSVNSGTATSYSWSNGTTSQTATGLGAGTYTVTVTSTSGCTTSASTTVTSTGGIAVTTTSTDATCGVNNGSATVSVNSGTAASYNWSNGTNLQTATGLGAGTYTVTVTSTGGCSITASTTVISAGGITVTTVTTDATCGVNNGSATVNVTAGAATGYNWSSGANTQTASNLIAGSYTVTVTDASGCSATAGATVSSTSGIAITATPVNTTCGNSNGSVTVNVVTGTATGYSWSNFENTATISNLAAGTYTVTVTGAGGCTASASAVVNPSGNTTVTVSSDKTIMCSGDTAHVCAPSGFTSYLWNTGAVTQCIDTKLAGNYYVTVTDAGNCTATSNHLAINVHPLPPVSISVNGDTLLSYNALTYQWYLDGNLIQGATSPLLIATQSGYYTVLVSDANGCTALSLPVEVTVTGVVGIRNEEMKIYPNPSESGVWNLDCAKELIGGAIEIFDVNGGLVYKALIQSPRSRIELTVARGLYQMRINSHERIRSLKLIKL